CNLTLTATSGHIQSPATGSCRWEVKPLLALAMQIDIKPTNITFWYQFKEQKCNGNAKITDSLGQVLYEETDCRTLTNISDGLSTTARSVVIEWNYPATYFGRVHRFSFTYDGHPCSRLMRQSSGIIEYPADADEPVQSCEWQIEVEPGYQIQWSADLQLGNVHVEAAYLAVWEGTRLPSVQDGDSSVPESDWKFTGTTNKSSRTSGSFLYVMFYVDRRRLFGIPVSFRLSYRSQHSSICGGHFQSPSGRFLSHREFGHSRYPKNADCAWLLASDPHHYLNLSFVNFSTPAGGGDYMMTYSSWNSAEAGFNVAFPTNRNITSGQVDVTGKIKGDPQLPVRYIDERQTRLKTVFATDDSQDGEDPTRAGFLAVFQQHCGGELTAGSELQAVESPRDTQRTCSWTIVANDSLPEASVLLYFSQVHCRLIDLAVNYIYGSGVFERQICRLDYSSDLATQDLAFTANRARIYYRAYSPSFHFTAASGFVLHYGMARSSCDFDFSETFSGYIQSYPNIESISPAEPFFCEWRLQAGNGWIIKLEIMTLRIDAASDCHDNYLELRQLNDTEPEVTSLLCSQSFSSTESNRVFWAEQVRLKQRRGPITTPRNFQFKLKFTREPFVKARSVSGVLTSPLYPKSYMSNQDFVWRLRVPSWKIVQFTVEDFQIEPRTQRYCLKDSVERSIPDNGVFFSATSDVLFKFHTDFSIDHFEGFRIRWAAVSKSQRDCNHVLKASQLLQTFTYPSPPATNYENRVSNCRFTIRLDTRQHPRGHSVFVNFTKVDLEDYYDQLRITVDSAQIRSQSVTSDLSYFETKPTRDDVDAMIVLSFNSDYSITRTGFTFSFGIGCRGFFDNNVNIARQPLILRAPVFSNSNYRAGDQCRWTIENFEEDALAIRFNSFDLAASTDSSNNCESADRLNLTDSITGSQTLYCAANLPAIRRSINVTARQLIVQFNSRSSSTGARGFNLEISRLLAGCDREVALSASRSTVSITDGLFRQHRMCSLTVYGPDTASEIVVRPVNIAFPPSSVCNLNNAFSGSYLKVSEDASFGRPPQVMCRNNVHDVISRGSPVTLTTYTDERVPSFNITVSLATCGGAIPSDRMTSPNYPDNYGNNLNCVWRSQFAVPMNVKLQFNYRVPCNTDSIKLTDCSPIPQNFSRNTLCSSDSGHELQRETLNIESIQCLQVEFKSGFSSRGAVRKFEAIVEIMRSGCYHVAQQSPNQISFDLSSGAGLTSASCGFNLRGMDGYAVRAVMDEGTQCDQGCQSSCRLLALQPPDNTRQWRYLPAEFSRIASRRRFPIMAGQAIHSWTSRVLVVVYCRNPVVGYRLRLRVDFPFQQSGCNDQLPVPSNPFQPLQISSSSAQSVNGSLQRMCAWKLMGSGDQKTTVVRINMASVDRGRSRRCRTYIAVVAVHTSQSDSSRYSTTLFSMRCPNDAINEVLLTNAGEVYVYFMGLNSDGGGAQQPDFSGVAFVQDCGGFFRSATYDVNFISFPEQNTANGTQCAWTFGHAQIEHPSIVHNLTILPSNVSSLSSCRESVTIDFMQSQLHGSQTPTSYSRVFDSCREASLPIGRTFLQRAAMLKLSYRSHLSTSGHLSARYQSYMSHSGTCFKSLSGRRGNFSSDNFPRAYERRNCTWIIHSVAGTAVRLSFFNENFGVGMTGQCERTDRIEVWDPNGLNGAVKLLSYCHTSQAPSKSFLSTSNQLMVRLVSTSSHPGTGFKAKFRVICSRVLRRQQDTILHDGRYHIGRTCTYYINGDAKDTAIVKLLSLDLIDGEINILMVSDQWWASRLSYKTSDGVVSRASYLRINSRNQARFKGATIFASRGIRIQYTRPRARRRLRSGQFRFRYNIERCNENVTLTEGAMYHYKDLFKSTLQYFFCRSHFTIPQNDRLFVSLRILLPPHYQKACTQYSGKRIITLPEPQNRSLNYYEVLNSNSIEHNICVDSGHNLHSWWYNDEQEYSVYQMSTGNDMIYSSITVDMSIFILPGPNRGCGADLQATEAWQTVSWNPQILSAMRTHLLCMYRIAAGPNQLVELHTNESLNWWVYVRGSDSSPFSKSASRETSGTYGRTVEVLLRHFGQEVLPLQFRAVSDTYQVLSVNATGTVQRYSVGSVAPDFRLRLRISGPAQRRLLVTFENVSLTDCRSQYFTAHDMPSNDSTSNSQLNNEDFFFCTAADFSHNQYESVRNSLEVYFHNSNSSLTGGQFTVAYVIE
uniref:Cubilin n=1 Tax=Macrostomum lignano TaxID=282301 RepID=A0A1I8JJR3_9PLAT